MQSAQLIVGRNACFLNVQVEDEAPPFNGGDRRLGIDLGINNIAAFSKGVGGRLRVSEPNAASGEAEGREAIEAELGCKFMNEFVSS